MRLFYILVLSSLLGVVGCKSKTIIPAKNYEAAQKIVDTSISEQRKSTNTIREVTKEAEAKAPEVQPEMTVIRAESDKIDTNAQNIVVTHQAFVEAATKESTELVKEKQALEKKVATLEDANNAQHKRILSLIIIGAGLATSVSVALFFLGNLRSLTITFITGSVLIGAIALQFLTAYMLWIGLVVTLLMGGYIVYQAFLNKRSLTEVIYTAERAKESLGKETFAAIAQEEQSNSTITMVKTIRDKEGLSSNANV
jgi:hypothetical protein